MTPALTARTLAVLATVLLTVLAAACSEEATSSPHETDSPASVQHPAPAAEGDALARLIESAAAGDTVLVPSGTYYEEGVISKPLTLQPAGDGPVIIDGECERDSGIRIPTGSDITISGIEIRNTAGAGVFIGNGDPADPRPERITLDGLTISDFNCVEGEDQYNAGIAAFLSGCCLRITNNTITYRSEGDVHGKGDGIWFKSNSEAPSGGGHYIAGNVITGGWDGIGGENEGDIHGTFDRDTTIENNVVSGCWDDGIQAEGGNVNVTIRDNRIEGCGTGIALAPTLVGPLYVERNVIRDLETGLYDNRFCFKVGAGEGGIAYLTENICQTEGGGLIQTNDLMSRIVTDGNCFAISEYVIVLGGLPEGSAMDGDHLWTSSDVHFIDWEGDDLGLTDFRRATGFERNGRESEDCPLG